MNSRFKFPRRVRIHGGECGAVARALHHEAKSHSLPAVKENVFFTTNERKSMSTKTMFKRIALVTVSALGFGLLTSVAPSSAATSTSLNVAVGPNNATSLTVVGGNETTTAALVRVDVTVDSANAGGTDHGLNPNETVTATISAVPTAVTAKTLAVNGGSLADTATIVPRAVSGGTAQRGDLVMLVSAGQTAGTVAATAATSTSVNTNWSILAETITTTNMDTSGAWTSAERDSYVGSGTIGSQNTGYVNKDSIHETTNTKNTKSYYVTIRPRQGATVIDQGAYTISFQLTDAAGLVRATKTVKIDFVSSAAKSDGTVAIASAGTLIASSNGVSALTTQDTSTNATIKVTLTNRDGGLIRLNNGSAPSPSVKIQESLTDAPVYADTATLTINDSGTYGSDFGRDSTTSPGNGTLQAQDGVYGISTSVLPSRPTSSTTGSVVAYRVQAGYGNATIVTSAITLFAPGGSGTAKAENTDVLVTAAGMSAADQLEIVNDSDGAYTWTLPTSTTSATVRFNIETSADTATPGAALTVTPTWSGSHGSANVTPATSTTGTVYTTDASGNFTVTVTNTAPVAGASVALKVTGGAAFGGGSYTATLTWAAPAAATIAVADPLSGVYVKTGTTNVTTVIVKDQFGSPVANQSVSVALSSTSANYSATTTIAPITTGANGTATYSLVGGATTATLDTLTFACVPTACTTTASATMTYNYVSTVPAVGSLAGYYNQDWNTTAVSGTLWPATGNLYATGTTELSIAKTINTSKAMNSYADSTSDALVSLALYGLTSAGASATGAVVTVSAASGGHILDASGLPTASRNFLIGSTGWTSNIQILATKTGDITFTATSGTVSNTFTLKVANANTDARFVTITSAATGTANGAGVPVTIAVTDRFGNPVASVALVVRASGVGSLLGGATSTSFTTDDAGTYTFLATSLENAGGVGTFTVSSSTSADFGSVLGYSGATVIDSTVAAGNSSKSVNITFAAGVNAATAAAEAATDAAAEAIDAANAATDAANLAAEAADAATVAAEEARDAADAATAAVEELATQVATLMAALKAQITTLANTVAKIAKKVKA